MPTVKHDSGGVMTWTCFAATGSGHLIVSESNLHISILDKTRFDYKHSNKTTTERLKRERVNVLQWTEVLSWDLKRAVHKGTPANLNELK